MRQRRFKYGSKDPYLVRLSLREAMSHAQTDQMASDGSLLTIGWQRGRMHTANAATVTSCEAAK